MRLPTECFQLVFEILATDEDTRTLSTLLRVSKTVQAMALPYLYQEPFWVFRLEHTLEHAHHDIVRRLQDYPGQLERQLEHRPPRLQRRFAKWDSFSLIRMLLGCVKDRSVITDFIRVAYKLGVDPPDQQGISASGKVPAPATATKTEAVSTTTAEAQARPTTTTSKATARGLRTMLSGPPSIDYLTFLKRLRVNYYTHIENDFRLGLRKFCQSLDAKQRAESPHAALYDHIASREFGRIGFVLRIRDILSMELTWALCNERLEQLQSLSIYLEEIDRYLAVVDRLPLLSRVCFEQGTEANFNAKSEAEKERTWRGTVLFVERHTQLFGTLREIDYPACPQSMRWQLWRALPVVLDPRRIDATNWLQFHAQTDRTRLDHVTSIQIPAACFSFLQGYLKTMEQSEPYLHRCRRLQRYEMPFLGADVDSFEWAVKEKLEAGYIRQDPNTATSTTTLPSISSLSLSDLQHPIHRPRVMVKHVKVQANIGVMDGWLENVAFAFSESLETFSIRDDVSNPHLSGAHVTRWNLPRLRKLEMQSRRSLHFDTGMLVHSPLLEELVLRDHVTYLNDFEWDAVVLQEPLRLPKLQILRLKGIPAITFHPHSFLTGYGQSDNDDNSSNDHDDHPGMPNLHTLSLNVNGSMDPLPTTTISQHAYPAPSWMTVGRDMGDANWTIPAVWSQLRNRSFWNWTWNMPQLTVLELRGDFALYFDLEMLKRTPALEVLSLDIWSRLLPPSAQTRTLDLSELVVAGKEQQLESEAVTRNGEPQREQQELLVLSRLTHLHLQGPWIINGPTLKSLLTRVMPNLICISECGCRGFNLREWMEATVQLKHLLSSNMYTMTSQDVPLKVIKQYELKAGPDRSNMEALEYVFLKIHETMEMSILANWWPGPRRQRELKESGVVEYVFAGSIHTRPRRASRDGGGDSSRSDAPIASL